MVVIPVTGEETPLENSGKNFYFLVKIAVLKFEL
jgi:hypothetical protein